MTWQPRFIMESTAQRKLAFEWLAECSTEEYLMSPDIFGLTTASPLQRSICRVIDGLPIGDFWDDQEVRDAFGGVHPGAGVIPKELIIIAGIRGGKTMLAAAIVAKRSITGNLAGLTEGEVARASICSPALDNSMMAFEYLTLSFEKSPALREVRLEDPVIKPGTIRNTIRIYNPLHHAPVDIVTIAARRGGSGGVSRWQAAFVVDEAARMLADLNEGVVNYEEVRKAVIHRIRPGGVFVAISSPWEPTGPIYEASKKVGKPTKQLLAVHAPAWAMNPHYWTPEAVADAKAQDELAYITDVCAQFTSQDHQFFNLPDIEKSMAHGRTEDLEPVKGARYTVVIDAAGRKNTFSLAISTSILGIRTVACYREWTGTTKEPLDLNKVMDEVCELAQRYGESIIYGDRWSLDAIDALARIRGCYMEGVYMTSQEQTQRFTELGHLLRLGCIELPALQKIREDYLSIRRKMSRSGPVVEIPMTGARHADGAVACTLALTLLEGGTYEPSPEIDPMVAWRNAQIAHFAGVLAPKGTRQDETLRQFDKEVDHALDQFNDQA